MATPSPRPRAPRERQEGAISVMAAVLAVAMIMATSLAVDVGRVAYTSRDQQGATDRAVLDALRILPASNTAASDPSDVWADVRDSVAMTLDGNVEGSSVGTSSDRTIDLLEVGYVDPSCPGPADFCSMWNDAGSTAYTGHWGSESVDTIRLSTESTVDFVFGFLDDDGYRDVIRQALGTNRRICPAPDPACPQPTLRDAEAGISIASRLVELNPDNSSILGPVVGQLIGSGSSLTLVGFDGLATADVPLSVFGDAGADVGSPSQLLDSQVTLEELLDATAAGLADDDAAVAADAQTALGELSANVDPALTVDVEDMLVMGTEDPGAFLEAEFPVLDLVMAGAMAAQVADGEHLVEVDLSGSDLLGLTGLSDIDLDLTIVEAPQIAYGKAEWLPDTSEWATWAETAQVDADLTIDVLSGEAETLLGDAFDLIGSLLCAGSCVETVTIDLAAAEAHADLVGIECVDPVEETDTTMVVSSSTLTADIGSGTETLVSARDFATSYNVDGEVVVVDAVPGVEATGHASVTGVLVLDAVVDPVFSLLGIGTGTAYAATHDVRCDVPVLLPNPL